MIVNATTIGGASIVEIQLLQKHAGAYLGTTLVYVMVMEGVEVITFVDADVGGMDTIVSMKDLYTSVVEGRIWIQLFVVDMESVSYLNQEEALDPDHRHHHHRNVIVMMDGGETGVVTKPLQ
jgi:hypothetical protein